MTAPAHVLVIDIGKTNAKLALVDTASMREIEVLTRPNGVIPGPPYPHVDTDGLWAFILDGIRTLNGRPRADALVVTTHAATAALLCTEGSLALPILDYEHDGPDRLAAEYDRIRPGFAETGSPRLPAGLNLGAQLFWQFETFPAAARTASILTYPQFWAFRLSGVPSVEPTSLGSHTDLWNPRARAFSSLVDSQGWASRMAPLRAAADRLGPITREVAEATGLDPATPVHCGIHDSNASLLPHLRAREAPFSVVSTGTWVISMAIGGRIVELDPQRDTLINVNAFGDPVPSARFMGGREWATAMQGRSTAMSPGDVTEVLDRGVMLLPAVEQGSGPFAGRQTSWSVPENTMTDGERAAAVSFYLALMTATCLADIGAEGPVLIEGPFAANAPYGRMLEAATGRPILPPTGNGTGTSAGAALLTSARFRSGAAVGRGEIDPARDDLSSRLSDYTAAWRKLLAT